MFNSSMEVASSGLSQAPLFYKSQYKRMTLKITQQTLNKNMKKSIDLGVPKIKMYS